MRKRLLPKLSLPKIIVLALCSVVGISLLVICLYLHPFQKKTSSLPDSQAFASEMDTLFKNEITSNTLNLHYTLKDPDAYGITDYPITLGKVNSNSSSSQTKSFRKVLKNLDAYDKSKLTTEQQLTYDLLSDYLHSQLSLCSFEQYQEPLIPQNGIQSQLPILFAEYAFYTEQDVQDYLALLAQTDVYYSSIINFEKEKAAAGLFMSDSECNDIIHECETFIAEPEKNYLLTTFENKIQEVPNLSEDSMSSYCKQNQTIVRKSILPAYEILINGLTKLMGSGHNNWGLCYYPNGRNYYKQLVYSDTGFPGNIPDLEDQIAAQRSKDLLACADIVNTKPDTIQACADCKLDLSEPDTVLQTLQQAMLVDFPKAPDTTCSVNYVDPSLQKYLAPAFYITAPLDSYQNNHIYINSARSYPDIYYFTTLAHEGFPGHLYQTVMTYSSGIDRVRSLLNYPGYIEGWATYVEMQSYYYANLDPNVASMLQHNQAATLSLYATSDIGIHYRGWTANDMNDFWGKYGITDHNSIEEITELIVSTPGNYLKYYVGYLEFLSLKEKMQQKYGDQFTPIRFHQTILDIGPAPFQLLEDYFDCYWSKD